MFEVSHDNLNISIVALKLFHPNAASEIFVDPAAAAGIHHDFEVLEKLTIFDRRSECIIYQPEVVDENSFDHVDFRLKDHIFSSVINPKNRNPIVYRFAQTLYEFSMHAFKKYKELNREHYEFSEGRYKALLQSYLCERVYHLPEITYLEIASAMYCTRCFINASVRSIA